MDGGGSEGESGGDDGGGGGAEGGYTLPNTRSVWKVSWQPPPRGFMQTNQVCLIVTQLPIAVPPHEMMNGPGMPVL